MPVRQPLPPLHLGVDSASRKVLGIGGGGAETGGAGAVEDDPLLP